LDLLAKHQGDHGDFDWEAADNFDSETLTQIFFWVECDASHGCYLTLGERLDEIFHGFGLLAAAAKNIKEVIFSQVSWTRRSYIRGIL
jgi:hypothetical protein